MWAGEEVGQRLTYGSDKTIAGGGALNDPSAMSCQWVLCMKGGLWE